MFLEVDRGTEPLKTWRQKTETYLTFAISGEFERRFSRSRFRVLVVTSTSQRLEAIRGKAIRPVTEKIFWFTTLEAFQAAGPWAPIWHRPSGNLRLGLGGTPT